MSFRNSDGSYVGGCGAQIGGLFLIPVMAFVIEYLPWRVITIVIIAIFALLIIVSIIYNMTSKELREERNEKKRIEEIYRRINRNSKEDT